MKFEDLMYISSEIKRGFKIVADIREKYGNRIEELNQEDYTTEQLEKIEKENEEIDELMNKAGVMLKW